MVGESRKSIVRKPAPLGVARPFLVALASFAAVRGEAHAAPATQLAVSNNPCAVQICPHPVPTPVPLAQANTTFGIFVSALDAGNAQDIFYAGTVIFSSSDPAATLPTPYTFVSADEGGRGFSVVLRSPGSHTITVMDASGSLRPGSLTMTVTAPGLGVEIPTLTEWMQLALALLIGLAGAWVILAAK